MQTLGYIPGVWDLLHAGHVETLERAANLCDRLIVGVAGDDAVTLDKGEGPAIQDVYRANMVGSLWMVDTAVVYPDLDFIHHLSMFRPDVMFVGMYWGVDQRHIEAEAWCRINSCRMIRLPYSKLETSTDIKLRIRG